MLRDFNWSDDRDYKTGSDDDPLEFYLGGLTNSLEFSMLLGYFSSAAINLLSLGFALFISKGGKVKMVINQFLSAQDKAAVEAANQGAINKVFDLTDPNLLNIVLSEYDTHFFECLAYLISEGRIEIKIIRPREGRGIAHYKSGVFSDGKDYVGYKASCNFTLYGLSENLEELEAFLSWENGRSDKLINKQIHKIKCYFDESDPDVEYISPREIEVAILNAFGKKGINELLVQEEQLVKRKQSLISNSKINYALSRLSEEIDLLQATPRFPFPKGPRPYQREAYECWVANNYKGMFAMATGTGKTITSLNCVLNQFHQTGYYKFIVLVPTNALALQWKSEIVEKFNFRNVVVCSSDNPTWHKDLCSIGKNVIFKRCVDYALVVTYATFGGVKFQTAFKEYFPNDYSRITLIADEAHRLGSAGFGKVLPDKINYRIGLSATPKRQFDEAGNSIISNFFSLTGEKYTFEYNMKTAIDNDVLCRYYYYPKIVSLEHDEQDSYIRLTKELSKFIDPDTGLYRDSDYVKALLIRRKAIIHKARLKKDAIISIVSEIGSDNFQDAFIYVPEGGEVNTSDSDYDLENDALDHKLIDLYIKSIYEKFGLRMAKFTGETRNRDQLLNQFKEHRLDALVAMKCLDEGVDVPQAKYAIFCSSTGNPRQYIQRRGRVLRKHPGKDYAYIYDLVIRPMQEHTLGDTRTIEIERNLFVSELRRLVNFSVLSENKDTCLNDLEEICYQLGIDIYELANEELNKYE